MDGNSLAISGYGYDPYFMAAYQSYNPNFKGVRNPQTTDQAVPQAPASETPVNGNVNTSFKGASEEIKGKKKSHKWWTALLAGAAIFAGIKGHKIGVGDKWYTKTVDGLKRYWNQGVNAIGKLKFKTNSTTSIQQTLALPAGGVQKRSFWFFSEDGKHITKCTRNGQEFDFSQLPESFLESVKRDLKIAV